jgi:ribosome-associated protein
MLDAFRHGVKAVRAGAGRLRGTTKCWQSGEFRENQSVKDSFAILLANMLEITPNLCVPDSEFEWTYVRSSGPGGQNVNKVASKAVLRWDAKASASLPPAVKARLLKQHGNRFTAEGVLVLTSQRFRDQERNRQDCLEKLNAWLLEAAMPPRPRKATKPSRGSKERRLQAKKQRASTKAQRRRPHDE